MNEKQREAIRKKVRERKKFYQHLIVFGSMASLIFVLNLITGFRLRFLFFPILGWGVGVAIHFITTIGFNELSVFSDDWEEKEIEKELEKHEKIEKLDLDDLRKSDPQKESGSKWDDSEIV